MKKNRSEIFKEWKLNGNPFYTIHPSSSEDLKNIITGREYEIDQLTSLATTPRGFFINGMFGIGKTVLVLESLRRMNSNGIIDIYCSFDRTDGFLKTILKALSKKMASEDRDAKDIYEILTKGQKVISGKTQTTKNARLKVPVADGGLSHVREEGHNQTLEILDPLDSITNIVEKAIKQKKTIVIAVDDIERKGDISSIKEIIDHTRNLIAIGCSIILTGHPIGVTKDFKTSSGGILMEIPLHQLSKEELVEMMIKYMQTKRRHVSDDTYPITAEGADWIAENLSHSTLTPRLFNLACFHLMEKAAKNGCKIIDKTAILEIWPNIADELLINLEEKDKEYLRIIYKSGGISEDSDEEISLIGGDMAEFEDVVNKLEHLIKKDILMEKGETLKREIVPNPLIENFFKNTES